MHIVYSDRHKLHATDGPLPASLASEHFYEVPARAEIILEAARQAGLGPVSAPADHGLGPILAVHDSGYVDFLRTIYQDSDPDLAFLPATFAPRGARHKPPPGSTYWGRAGYYAFGVGSPILAGTWEAAYWSAQVALTAADHALAGEGAAYALCRPPGHHAAGELYGGFCYLNNAAIAARYLQQSAGRRRVAIVDVDYHHGNGTQEIFYEDPGILFCSLHANPDEDYPYYWGAAGERGAGPGAGFTRNWPLPQQTGDAAYLAVLDEALAVVREFAPEAVVVSAGFDIALGDPVGGFCITPDGLAQIGARLAALGRPTLIVQEGGYLLEKLGENAVAFLRGFAESAGTGA